MDDDLQLKRALGRSPASHTWRCPGDETLAAYADSSLSSGRESLERHLAGCARCREQVAALIKLSDRPLPKVPPSLIVRASRLVEEPKNSPFRIPRWAFVCAALCLTLVAVPVVRQLRTSRPYLPERPSEETVRSVPAHSAPLALQSPSEGASLTGDALELRWNPAPGALSYEVRVQNADGDVKWQGNSDSTSLRVPSRLRPGKYYVSVSAKLADGKTPRSPSVQFQVTSEN